MNNQQFTSTDKCLYVISDRKVKYPLVSYDADCGYMYALIKGYNIDYNSDDYGKLLNPSGKCSKCGREITVNPHKEIESTSEEIREAFGKVTEKLLSMDSDDFNNSLKEFETGTISEAVKHFWNMCDELEPKVYSVSLLKKWFIHGYKTAKQSAQADRSFFINRIGEHLEHIKELECQITDQHDRYVDTVEELKAEYREIDNINTDLRIDIQKLKQQIDSMKTQIKTAKQLAYGVNADM